LTIMNTTLATRELHPDHPPLAPTEPRQVRRVGLADRIALRVGIALITWSRRPLALESRERRATRVEQHLARLAREQAAEVTYRLTTPIR
jgi:hypothetical protein